MKHLLPSWPDIGSRIREASRVLLMSDFDGTLAPIVARPELAQIPDYTRSLLDAIAGHPKYQVCIVSGRSLEYLRSQIGLEGVVYAGNHGLEIEGAGYQVVNLVAEQRRPLMFETSKALEEAYRDFEGILVEHKTLTTSVHYRGVPRSREGEVKAIFEGTLAELAIGDRVKVTLGKKVIEVRPLVEWGKGQAVGFLVDESAREATGPVLAVFIGDDVTDEEGFTVLNSRGGVSVYVGDGGSQSEAKYYLASTEEVKRFLELLVKGL